jgi:L-rhamnose mutarotase
MKRYCLALDLKNDPHLITEYKEYHQQVWPEIIRSIKDSGIIDLEIYLVENRLFMILESDDSFTFEKKMLLDSKNTTVKEWEALMWKYQQALPLSKPDEKWRLMDLIFSMRNS